MTTIRYLILAHSATAHLSRLVQTLSTDGARIFVHVDAKSAFRPFRAATWAAHVTFTERRVRVVWGGFGMVEATIALIRQALQGAAPGDRLVLLSAADFPLVPPGQVKRFFDVHPNVQFMNLAEMPFLAGDKRLTRISRHYFPFDRRDGELHLGARALNLLRLPRRYKRLLGSFKPYCGSQWWSLTAEAAAYIVDEHEQNRTLARLYQGSYIPDEAYLHTLIGNSRFAKNAYPALTFTDWSRPEKPAVIDGLHIDYWALEGGLIHEDVYGTRRVLFARKFPDNSAHLVSRIEDEIWPLTTGELPTIGN